MKTYDVIVIGAGIAGCCSAFFLKQKGLDVLVVDRSGVASTGGSSAAGAFVSPKIGKGSPLQTLTNEAYAFAKDFYLEYFPKHFSQTGIIRIPKDKEDAQKFQTYESFNQASRRWIEREELQKLGIKECFKSFLFDEAGVCDAPKMCEGILKNILYEQFNVKKLEQVEGLWRLFESDSTLFKQAKNIVLATGYENTLFDMRYMGVKGTWGSRGDYKTNLKLDVSMHKSISVSANIKGIIKLGATHNKAKDPCMVCDGEPLKKLFATASTMVNTDNFILKETFCGMRSGSKDYFPLLGSVIDVPYMLKTYPKLLRGLRLTQPPKKISNLYICNGLGGRGFVFAPIMGKMLADLMVHGDEVTTSVNPDRLFLKWCRKLPTNVTSDLVVTKIVDTLGKKSS